MAGQRARAGERDRARGRAVSRGERCRLSDLPDAVAEAAAAPPSELTFSIGTPLSEVEQRMIRDTLVAHRRGQIARRPAARDLDAHHLSQAGRDRVSARATRKPGSADARAPPSTGSPPLPVCLARRGARKACQLGARTARSRAQTPGNPCVFPVLSAGTPLA